ncbi:MAG: cardiolipin synthase [Lysobacteraceae bacterium]|nr:MAG: cardiolipin synthase [Xanthomonadaceae bacterium]
MGDTLFRLSERLLAIEHIGLYLYIGWVVYLVLLGGWIILQKREPVATLSWLLGLALLPYLGFVIYHLFGPQKIERQRLRRRRSRLDDEALGHLPDGPNCAPEARELARMAQTVTGLAPSSAREVRLLVDGCAKYEALIADLAKARQHVHLEYYIYTPDESGRLIRDALVDCARRGVRVRVLLDAIGSAKASRAFFAPLLDVGGELIWFHPTRLWRFFLRPWLNLRTHRKIVVIDNRIAYTGGINITDEENERLRSDAYRDLHLRIEGDVVRTLQQVFVEDWIYACGERALISEIVRSMPEASPGTVSAQVLTSGPDSSWEAIHRIHVGLIHAARARVWLVTPYFVPGEAAMMALTSAALGGLDVRLLVPKDSDSRLVTLAARSYYDELMAAGVKIYEYGPRMLHTKALLIDETTAVIGSANFDHRSFRLNFEVSVLFQDHGIALRLSRLIEGEFANAPRVRQDRLRPLLHVRLPEALARLLSPLL